MFQKYAQLFFIFSILIMLTQCIPHTDLLRLTSSSPSFEKSKYVHSSYMSTGHDFLKISNKETAAPDTYANVSNSGIDEEGCGVYPSNPCKTIEYGFSEIFGLIFYYFSLIYIFRKWKLYSGS
jgi:hypothetical protein